MIIIFLRGYIFFVCLPNIIQATDNSKSNVYCHEDFKIYDFQQ